MQVPEPFKNNNHGVLLRMKALRMGQGQKCAVQKLTDFEATTAVCMAEDFVSVCSIGQIVERHSE